MKLSTLFEHTILNESFKEAKMAFSNGTSSEEVDQYLEKYRELASKNVISGPDKDINNWIKRGFQAFKDYVDEKSTQKTGKDVKRETKNQGARKVADYPNWFVIVPLTKEASCHYGSGTKWCTAAKTNNKFNEYFHTDDITLFYIISKTSHEKYAIAYERADDIIQDIFDAKDDTIQYEDLERLTGINVLEDIHKWVGTSKDFIPTLEDTIAQTSPDEAKDILIKNAYRKRLTPEQIKTLQSKVASRADVLDDYCMLISNYRNGKQDALFLRTPKILLMNMLKSNNNFDALVYYLKEYINLLDDRNETIETMLPEAIKKFNQQRSRRVLNMVNDYTEKFGLSPDEKRKLLGLEE